MAGTIIASFTLSFTPTFAGSSPAALPLAAITVTVSGTNYKKQTQVIPTTAGGTPIDVSALVTPRWCAFINRDPTNYVEILNAVSGTLMFRLLPGEGCMGPLDPSVSAPAALAHTASVLLEMLIIEN